MIVREATEADFPAVRDLVAAYDDEFWRRPFPPQPLPDEWLRDGRLLVAERDGKVAGVARGDLRHGLGRISFVYLLPEHRRHGLGSALVLDLLGFFRKHGAEYVTLGVDISNEDGAAVWRRLGFTEFSREMSAELDSLERRLGETSKEESFGSVHVQTDDQSTVAAAVERFVPRLFRSPATVVSAPRHGWVALYNDVASREPERLRRLGSELSHITGGVVLALGVEEDAVVRTIAFERGRLMDEYLSVPNHYGTLPPGRHRRASRQCPSAGAAHRRADGSDSKGGANRGIDRRAPACGRAARGAGEHPRHRGSRSRRRRGRSTRGSDQGRSPVKVPALGRAGTRRKQASGDLGHASPGTDAADYRVVGASTRRAAMASAEHIRVLFVAESRETFRESAPRGRGP